MHICKLKCCLHMEASINKPIKKRINVKYCFRVIARSCRAGFTMGQMGQLPRAPQGPSIKYVTLQRGEGTGLRKCDRRRGGKDHVTSHFPFFHNSQFYVFLYFIMHNTNLTRIYRRWGIIYPRHVWWRNCHSCQHLKNLLFHMINWQPFMYTLKPFTIIWRPRGSRWNPGLGYYIPHLR